MNLTKLFDFLINLTIDEQWLNAAFGTSGDIYFKEYRTGKYDILTFYAQLCEHDKPTFLKHLETQYKESLKLKPTKESLKLKPTKESLKLKPTTESLKLKPTTEKGTLVDETV